MRIEFAVFILFVASLSVGVGIGKNIVREGRTEKELRALAAAIIEVDGGNGSIDELLAARADSEQELRKMVRRILDKKSTINKHQEK